MMAQAQQGDTVRVHYTGMLGDGSQFDSSRERQEPMEFTIGQRQLIPSFEQAVVGMEPGDSKTVNISSGDAYGPHDPSQVIKMSRSQIPDSIDLKIGLRLQGRSPSGQTSVFTVTDLTESSVTMDGNHPLAGQDLTFEIELVEIV
jgi:peptidylprolyl isomerase